MVVTICIIIFVPLIYLKVKLYMKKTIIAVLLLVCGMAFLSSCGPSRKTGCPMTENILH